MLRAKSHKLPFRNVETLASEDRNHVLLRSVPLPQLPRAHHQCFIAMSWVLFARKFPSLQRKGVSLLTGLTRRLGFRSMEHDYA